MQAEAVILKGTVKETNPLTTVTTIRQFDVITHAAIHQTRPD